MRPTTPPDDQAADEPGPDSTEGTELEPEPEPTKQGRGPRRRRTRVDDAAVKGRKLSLPDSVHLRLNLLALQRGKTASAIATEILDRNLPRLRIEKDEG